MGYARNHGNTPLPLASCEAVPCCFFGAPSVGAVTCFLSRQSQSGLQKTQGLVNCRFCVWHGAHFLFSNESSLRCVEFEQQKNIYRATIGLCMWTNRNVDKLSCKITSNLQTPWMWCSSITCFWRRPGFFFVTEFVCLRWKWWSSFHIYIYIYSNRKNQSQCLFGVLDSIGIYAHLLTSFHLSLAFRLSSKTI